MFLHAYGDSETFSTNEKNSSINVKNHTELQSLLLFLWNNMNAIKHKFEDIYFHEAFKARWDFVSDSMITSDYILT